MEFCYKNRDESNPEEKGKHGKFTTKISNNGEHERRNRCRSRSERRNRNTKSDKQGTLPAHETENRTSKECLHLTNKGSIQNIRLTEDKDFASL